ncbi:hypothetical protein DVA67_022185 [Solirubrobacter sp. CPCC 204708]|uniref:Uncharacterized protein n=1 Tax=Solirubrobacter deserti TaxID=2282478 RepID=A0ABT4RTS9_9ACTN|nr:hypothetical protein [Solirubrobacter deserti]MBE2318703.1 hypothetical protein [Solirubrobacter deserti]MDA0141986.1 hypothetical protein [Solirubrobacter deserti]
MRRPVTALIALGAAFGIGATALAQSGDDRLSIDLQNGCLNHARVTMLIEPPSGKSIDALSVYANGREVLDLTGLSGDARMTVRLTSPRGRVTVRGELAGGENFSRSRDYRPCAPAPPPRPAPQRTTRPEPEPTLSGGGEG